MATGGTIGAGVGGLLSFGRHKAAQENERAKVELRAAEMSRNNNAGLPSGITQQEVKRPA